MSAQYPTTRMSAGPTSGSEGANLRRGAISPNTKSAQVSSGASAIGQSSRGGSLSSIAGRRSSVGTTAAAPDTSGQRRRAWSAAGPSSSTQHRCTSSKSRGAPRWRAAFTARVNKPATSEVTAVSAPSIDRDATGGRAENSSIRARARIHSRAEVAPSTSCSDTSNSRGSSLPDGDHATRRSRPPSGPRLPRSSTTSAATRCVPKRSTTVSPSRMTAAVGIRPDDRITMAAHRSGHSSALRQRRRLRGRELQEPFSSVEPTSSSPECRRRTAAGRQGWRSNGRWRSSRS